MIKTKLFVEIPRKTKEPKKYWLNLNYYRNWKFIVSNQVKHKFAEDIREQVKELPRYDKPIKIRYVIYFWNNRSWDISNVLCIVDKFFCDVLVEEWKIKDDSYQYVCWISYEFWWVDKNNWRAEIYIDYF